MPASEPPERQRELTAQGRAVAYWAEVAPDRPALRSAGGGAALSFAELDARANRLARVLRAAGLRAGDGVALVCRNRPELAETWAACQRTGLRLTPVNWHLTPAEMAYIVHDSGARALLFDAHVSGARAVADAAPRAATRLAIGGGIEGFASYADAVGAQRGHPIEDPSPGTLMLYTSGTTGRPKGVRRQPRPPRVENAAGYRAGDVHLCTGPLYHLAPLSISLASPLANGATVVLMHEWDAEETLALVEAHRATHAHLVPTMFHRLLALPAAVRARYDLSSLRLVVHGASPCPVSVKRRMIEWLGPILVEYYAATEGVGTLVDSATWLARPGTVGRPVPPDQVIVGDEDARPLPSGEVGLLWLRHVPGERFEYHGDPEKTDRVQRGDRFTLGDLGYLDDDGFVFLVDRSADLIITGGVNVYPAEVDAALLEHPAVADAATIGVPDDEWGETVLALVETHPGSERGPALAAELIEHCAARIARFKCPRRIEFVEHLPRQDNGKVAKHRLRDEYRRREAERRAPRPTSSRPG